MNFSPINKFYRQCSANRISQRAILKTKYLEDLLEKEKASREKSIKRREHIGPTDLVLGDFSLVLPWHKEPCGQRINRFSLASQSRYYLWRNARTKTPCDIVSFWRDIFVRHQTPSNVKCIVKARQAADRGVYNFYFWLIDVLSQVHCCMIIVTAKERGLTRTRRFNGAKSIVRSSLSRHLCCVRSQNIIMHILRSAANAATRVVPRNKPTT